MPTAGTPIPIAAIAAYNGRLMTATRVQGMNHEVAIDASLA